MLRPGSARRRLSAAFWILILFVCFRIESFCCRTIILSKLITRFLSAFPPPMWLCFIVFLVCLFCVCVCVLLSMLLSAAKSHHKVPSRQREPLYLLWCFCVSEWNRMSCQAEVEEGDLNQTLVLVTGLESWAWLCECQPPPTSAITSAAPSGMWRTREKW